MKKLILILLLLSNTAYADMNNMQLKYGACSKLVFLDIDLSNWCSNTLVLEPSKESLFSFSTIQKDVRITFYSNEGDVGKVYSKYKVEKVKVDSVLYGADILVAKGNCTKTSLIETKVHCIADTERGKVEGEFYYK